MFLRSLLIVILALSRRQLLEAGNADFKCLSADYTKYFLPQYVIVNDIGAVDLSISSSSRPSHQIVSHLVHILLTEALGYQSVSVSSPKRSDQLTDIINNLGVTYENDVPDYMVDLEVWLPPGLSLDNLNQDSPVVSAGPLGPVAQYGWFLRNKTTDAFWAERKETIDHYRYWTNSSVASHFQASNEGDKGKADLVIPENVLSAGILEATSNLIDRLKLEVKSPSGQGKRISTSEIISRITKLGSKSADQLIKSKNDLLLLTWFPNVITARFPFQRISFSAPCSLEFDDKGTMKPQVESNTPCDPFPLFQLTKWVWSGLETTAPLAYSLIRNVALSQNDYESLLRAVNTSQLAANRSSMYRKIACNWLKKNNDTWQRWLPERPEKVKMMIGGMFPSDSGKWSDPALLYAARNGVTFANDNVLKGLPYEIEMEEHNISCDRQDEALFEYNQIVLEKCGKTRQYLLGILAASCSASIEPMILLNRHYRTIIISPTVESTKFSIKGQFPYFFRTVPDMRMYASYLSGTFQALNWKRAALFRKDDHFVNKQKFSHSDVEIVDDFETSEELLKFSDVTHNLWKSKRDNNARIFVVEYFEKGTSLVLCAASKLGMTAAAGYIWFLNPWIEDDFLSKEDVKDYYMAHGSCNLSEMMKTVEIYFVLTHLAASEKLENQSKYYPFVHDAVLVFAHALKKIAGNDTHILSRLSEMNTSILWQQEIGSINFSISNNSNEKFEFDERNTRPNSLEPYVLKQYKCEDTCTSVVVGIWQRESKNSSVEESTFKLKDISWIDNKVPGDGSREEDNCFWPSLARKTGSCAVAIIVVVLIAFLCIVAIGILLIIALRPHYKQLKEAKRQLAPFSDILNDLAPLEMKSFQIVLNLPLGEGAFGTVRGGEAKLYGQWHAVAVKTLHERATQEEKMEFLSEARIMKAFNHPNIVKLLGVRAQSKSEPYMTVMEFMLYGDMKKYLIARHVLAKEEPDHPDICPASLTSMTIDIVSGLEYLHENGYIHRDLALRNCLVGNNRQVKLCDFGLTREVNRCRDYYRFERRGMLPVRWMAPESLHSGVFTIKSDIWSFGVVLYEIVTFGNKPYRDKRNEDVIDCMRLGNDCLIRYLNNPEERLPKLLTLMRECFHFHPHERPDSAHILSYLKTDPCCVRPCLEEAPPDPGELPAGLLGPESGDRRRGGSGGGGGATTDRIRFHSGARGSTSTTAGVGPDSVFAFDYAGGGGGTQGGLVHNTGLNSSFPGRNQVNGARPALVNSTACQNDVRNYASSTEFIPMRSTRSLSGGLPDAHSPDNASPTTGLLETEISIGSEVDGLAACDYDTNAVTFSPFANGATPHSRASLGIGSSHGSLHSRLTHAS